MLINASPRASTNWMVIASSTVIKSLETSIWSNGVAEIKCKTLAFEVGTALGAVMRCGGGVNKHAGFI